MAFILFRHPEPRPRKGRVRPVFFPFMGCVGRCVYCAQREQTGRSAEPLETMYNRLAADLARAGREDRGPFEIGFYGGTFTALPAPWPERFVALAASCRESGLATRIRCSTRPDAVSPAQLATLKRLGLDMVELGAQSFDDRILTASGRNHTASDIETACDAVRGAGLSLGLQLLPGLPGHTPRLFEEDVRRASGLGPECVRLYPCVVVRGSRLAAMYDSGAYAPWRLAAVIPLLARAVLAFWAEGIQTARIGLAPQPELLESLAAGPWAPDLGNRVRALALYYLVRARAAGLGGRVSRLVLPRRYSGELWGRRGELAPAYAQMGLNRRTVRFWDEEACLLFGE